MIPPVIFEPRSGILFVELRYPISQLSRVAAACLFN
jgi:hypothetical protein